jgi:hypothetical protein
MLVVGKSHWAPGPGCPSFEFRKKTKWCQLEITVYTQTYTYTEWRKGHLSPEAKYYTSSVNRMKWSVSPSDNSLRTYTYKIYRMAHVTRHYRQHFIHRTSRDFAPPYIITFHYSDIVCQAACLYQFLPRCNDRFSLHNEAPRSNRCRYINYPHIFYSLPLFLHTKTWIVTSNTPRPLPNPFTFPCQVHHSSYRSMLNKSCSWYSLGK